MKRVMLAALIVSAATVGGVAHAGCTGTGTSAGVVDLYTTQIGVLKADVRIVGAPLPPPGPTVTAASVCSDGTVGPAAAMQLKVTDTRFNWIYCNEWMPLEPGVFEPTVNGGIFRMQEAEGVECGINGTFNTDPNQRSSATYLSAFPAIERSDYVGIRFAASFTGASHATGHVWGPSGSEYYNAGYGTHFGFTGVAYGVGIADYTL